MLQEIAKDLWVTNRPLRFFSIDVGCRMTIIRLADGSLFFHSPVPFEKEMREHLNNLGTVSHIIAPNYLHHLYVGDYTLEYPEARLYGAPGLDKKRRDLSFYSILGNKPDPAWAGQIDQMLFDSIFFKEVVFFHRQSRTLILTDLAFHIKEAPSWRQKIFWKLNGAYQKFGPTRLEKLLLIKKKAFRSTLDKVLEWDIERIIVSHGEILETGGRDALAKAYSWVIN